MGGGEGGVGVGLGGRGYEKVKEDAQPIENTRR